MNPAKIALLEDDTSIAAPVESYLTNEGFRVTRFGRIAELRAAGGLTTEFDLFLVDWMLPDGQSIDFVRELRSRGVSAPVIFVTARADVVDRVLGLEVGGDDYVVKPFDPRELSARVRARLRVRRPAESAEAVIRVGDLRIDLKRRQVLLREKSIDLTKTEFDLLCLFAKSPAQVFAREELLASVWGYERMPTTRTVDQHILQLRQKLGSTLFETVHGIGYRFLAESLRFSDNSKSNDRQSPSQGNLSEGNHASCSGTRSRKENRKYE